MPSIARRRSSSSGESVAMTSENDDSIISVSNWESTPQKRKLRSSASAARESPVSTPMKWKSPSRSMDSSPTPNSPPIAIEKNLRETPGKLGKSAVKKLSDDFTGKPNWNPRGKLY
ncbi:hypothetical protein Tsubulata_001304 [Turnera subulata]|uniref:Uncharacterized protein n=1 Tax=Turnera subulata TaxID=218843 RepID=A0A9Q0FEM4_9ROSI|nr:hypothetical protein Tsubulata_001304 [Turnera subulata]